MYYRALGGIKNIESTEVHQRLKAVIPAIKGRSRLFGYDIEYEGKDLEFFINTYDEIEYYIDISSPYLDKLLPILNGLTNLLIDLNACFDIIYFMEEEDGTEISLECLFYDSELNNR